MRLTPNPNTPTPNPKTPSHETTPTSREGRGDLLTHQICTRKQPPTLSPTLSPLSPTVSPTQLDTFQSRDQQKHSTVPLVPLLPPKSRESHTHREVERGENTQIRNQGGQGGHSLFSQVNPGKRCTTSRGTKQGLKGGHPLASTPLFYPLTSTNTQPHPTHPHPHPPESNFPSHPHPASRTSSATSPRIASRVQLPRTSRPTPRPHGLLRALSVGAWLQRQGAGASLPPVIEAEHLPGRVSGDLEVRTSKSTNLSTSY